MKKQRSKQRPTQLEGIIKRHPDGFGFFIPDNKEHPDVYIPKHEMKGVFTNDKVVIEAFPENRDDRFRGNIIKILQRKTEKVAGVILRLNDQFAMIRDDGGNWGEDLKIPWSATGNAPIGKLVTAHITQYPGEGDSFQGEVLEVLGDVADPMNDIKRVIAIQQIPDMFPKEALQQVQNLQKNPEEREFAHRIDLRGKNLITIDGKTAKDFDDAILVERTPQGFKLFVAIADVSHYVTVGTPVDEEAYMRGNSVYFPNFVVPMLPEILSNHLCSLNPNVPRLCVVAEMDFDHQGQKFASKFYEAVMQSKARVTYGEAQEVIGGVELPQFAHVRDNILLAADLAKILLNKRHREGSLDLEIPETELIIDAKGEPVDVIRSERLFSHRLIEEMMLAANVAVAEFLSSKDIPALFRIHEPPFEDNLEKLQNFINIFGGKTKISTMNLQKKLSHALEEFAGTPHALAIHTLTLRSMNQAKYSESNVGHFGLGFDYYTHFTSPIRRYSDLIVHRLLKNQILPSSKYRLMSEEDLATAGTHLSGCEQKAAKAERLIKAIKKARFMRRFVGETFEGMINSVTKFGVFVLLRQYDIDGLIRLEDLSKEHLQFDEENMVLFGKRSGIRFQIGDLVQVVVSSTDIEAGQINFVLEQSTKAIPRPPLAKVPDDEQYDRRKKDRRQNRDRRQNPGGRRDREEPREFRHSRPRREEKEVREIASNLGVKSSTRPSGGLSPEEVEAKMRKLREDPRFQGGKRPEEKSSFDGKKSSKNKNVFAKLKSKRKQQKEGKRGSAPDDRPSRENNQKRGKTENNRRGVRKARLSKRR